MYVIHDVKYTWDRNLQHLFGENFRFGEYLPRNHIIFQCSVTFKIIFAVVQGHEQIKSRLESGECLLSFDSESFAFQVAIQKDKV
jgi:hypothetical protein